MRMIFQFIVNHKKTFIWLAVIIAAGIAFKLWKTKTDSEKAIGKLKVDKDALTITPNQATIISENLLNAMSGYGTDEKVIIDNLKTLRQDDLLLVMKTFGMKPYNGVGLASRGYEKKFFSTDLNLIGWLQEELDGDELDQVAQIFQQNNIPF